MNKVRVRVPGKILLAGEYAVLQGHSTLSMTLDRYLEVSLEIRERAGWEIHSELWSRPYDLQHTDLNLIKNEPLLQVAAFAAQHFALPNVECRVFSQLDLNFGFGSSTALRLGLLLAAQQLAHPDEVCDTAKKLAIASLCWRMQELQQGFASGYDVLTQALGGLLLWQPNFADWPGSDFQSLPEQKLQPWLTIMVGGKGAPTGAVGQSVRQAMQHAKLEARFNLASDHLIQAWLKLISHGHEAITDLFYAIRQHRLLLAQFPYFPEELFRELAAVPGFDQSWSIKTTGAGGEDALLLIGTPAHTEAARHVLNAKGWQVLYCSWISHGAQFYLGEAS